MNGPLLFAHLLVLAPCLWFGFRAGGVIKAAKPWRDEDNVPVFDVLAALGLVISCFLLGAIKLEYLAPSHDTSYPGLTPPGIAQPFAHVPQRTVPRPAGGSSPRL